MKGIILAGGHGTRLSPLTDVMSKQLLPVYNKPMIYYPLSLLLSAGINEIAIITRSDQLDLFWSFLGNGEKFGASFTYFGQESPNGIAEALLITKDWLQDSSCCLVLGDNIIYGFKFDYFVQTASLLSEGSMIFTVPVDHPERFGIVELDEEGKISAIVEKPKNPKSNLAIPGIYFFDGKAAEYASDLSYSGRGELEITDLLKKYLSMKLLLVAQLDSGIVWFDCGTHDSLLDASNFVKAVEKRTGTKFGDPMNIPQKR